MPVYTYECDNCGERFEAKQSFSDSPLTICPTCEGKLHRVIQPAGIVFKGSGFYVNDSRSKQNLATTGKAKDETKDGKETAKETGKDAAKDGKAASSEGSSSASTPATSSTESAPATSAEPSKTS